MEWEVALLLPCWGCRPVCLWTTPLASIRLGSPPAFCLRSPSALGMVEVAAPAAEAESSSYLWYLPTCFCCREA